MHTISYPINNFINEKKPLPFGSLVRAYRFEILNKKQITVYFYFRVGRQQQQTDRVKIELLPLFHPLKDSISMDLPKESKEPKIS